MCHCTPCCEHLPNCDCGTNLFLQYLFARHFKSLWTADNRLAFVAKILLSDSWQSARSERNMFTLTCACSLCVCMCVFSVPLGTSLSLGFGSDPDSRVRTAAVKLWVVGRVSARILGGW